MVQMRIRLAEGALTLTLSTGPGEEDGLALNERSGGVDGGSRDGGGGRKDGGEDDRSLEHDV